MNTYYLDCTKEDGRIICDVIHTLDSREKTQQQINARVKAGLSEYIKIEIV